MAAYSDDFSGTLADWTAIDGGFNTTGGTLNAGSEGSAFPRWIEYNNELDSKNHFCQIDFVSAESSKSFFSPIVNARLGFETGYVVLFRDSNSWSQIREHINGSGSQLVNTSVGHGPPATLKLERGGDFLRLYDNGVEIAEYELLGTTLDYKGVALTAHHVPDSSADNFLAEDLASTSTAPILSAVSATSITATSIVPELDITF